MLTCVCCILLALFKKTTGNNNVTHFSDFINSISIIFHYVKLTTNPTKQKYNIRFSDKSATNSDSYLTQLEIVPQHHPTNLPFVFRETFYRVRSKVANNTRFLCFLLIVVNFYPFGMKQVSKGDSLNLKVKIVIIST